MGTLTEMDIVVVIVTMVTVKVGGEPNIGLLWCMDVQESEVNLAFMGLRLRMIKGELT